MRKKQVQKFEIIIMLKDVSIHRMFAEIHSSRFQSQNLSCHIVFLASYTNFKIKKF